jgi:XTP/dITP diphosphohydrolase
MNSSLEDKKNAFGRLVTIMDDLRLKCPWDKKQTFQSLRNLTIEETYELADAIIIKDVQGIKEETGDLLLHMVFYAKIASEQNEWDITDALHAISEKLINRHPHIYGDLEVENAEEVKKNWEELKMKEGKKSVLSGVPQSLPALIKAYRMQDKTAQVGFEWREISDVIKKVREELDELAEAMEMGDSEKVEEEFGDVLFSLVNFSRFLKVDPETALEKINKKFKRRFEYIEEKASRPLKEMTLEDMDDLWNEAKVQGL